jgi:hypothetical protein
MIRNVAVASTGEDATGEDAVDGDAAGEDAAGAEVEASASTAAPPAHTRNARHTDTLASYSYQLSAISCQKKKTAAAAKPL